MNGLSLKESTNNEELIAIIHLSNFEGPFFVTDFNDFVKKSEFSQFHLLKAKVLSFAGAVNNSIEQGSVDPIEMSVGVQLTKDGKVSIAVTNDQMNATLTITSAHKAQAPSAAMIALTLKQQGIVRGVSQKRIRKLVQQSLETEPGTEISGLIAKGLVPRKGKDSYIKPLVSNSFDRVLAPQDAGSNKVDMRNLGDISCVTAGQSVARRISPSKGRTGFTVTNKVLKSGSGKWHDIELGKNTEISLLNDNVIMATLAGQAKFEDGSMSIDDTFVTQGVNLGTGNVTYDGAVIVNGDVTENMQIVAKGDVTVNGFVESALIQAGGDIIITKGAMGKMQQEDCRLFANGNVFIQHGQGLDIVAGKNINVAKQLAYSRVKCKGILTVGSPDHPMGNLFASSINCQTSVKAGSIGAVSGSLLNIDFSEGYNLLLSRSETLSELLKILTQSNADHEMKLTLLNNEIIPDDLKHKMAQLNDELESERILLNWIQDALAGILNRKKAYELNARVIAHKELFPGVTVRLNKKIWKSKKEHTRSRITIEQGNWTYSPLI